MKRRNFLSTASLAVATGMTSGLSAATTSYNKMSAYVSFQEFSDKSKTALDNVAEDMNKGFGSQQMVKDIVMPVRIIANKNNWREEKIIYTNKAGNYIRLSIKNGKEQFYISKTPIYK